MASLRRRPSLSTVAIVVALLAVGWDLTTNVSPFYRDLIRWIELGECVVVLALVLSTGRRYWLNYVADPTKARLLPRHVVRMSIGVAGLVLGAAFHIIHVLTQPFVWYASPILFPSLTLLAFGMWDLVSWLPDRTAPPDNAFRRRGDSGHNENTERVGKRVVTDRMPRHISRPGVVLFIMMTVFVTWTLWQGEHDSCVRTNATRGLLRVKYELDAERLTRVAERYAHIPGARNHAIYTDAAFYAAKYRRLSTLVEGLSCATLTPDTKAISETKIASLERRAALSPP